MSEIYTNVEFSFVDVKSQADIQLLLTEQYSGLDKTSPTKKESYKTIPQKEKVFIISSYERGLLNVVYALLEKQGYGFYIGGDVSAKS